MQHLDLEVWSIASAQPEGSLCVDMRDPRVILAEGTHVTPSGEEVPFEDDFISSEEDEDNSDDDWGYSSQEEEEDDDDNEDDGDDEVLNKLSTVHDEDE